MITLLGYQSLAQIYESANSEVYRGIREQDNKAVILKVLKEDYPTPSELTRYKQEYEITRNLNLDGVVKAYSLEPYQRTLVIILEDFGASSLKELINRQRLTLKEFLHIAIQTAESLGNIHSSNVIHKDINPSNIVFNPDTEIIKIIDFGIATVLTRENPTLKNPNVLEGTLAYMSPEQTGRMNRSLDYRTDFYSLGVSFYELLTGQLPFNTTDALELVHCHIAKQPVPPYFVIGEEYCPKVVSDIVMKLMAKTAEERYQSAWGLKADLEECLNQLQRHGEISEFPLGTQDISDKFQIPQKLYGRETEVETLLAAFERVAAGGIGRGGDEHTQLPVPSPQSKIELMLVAGYSGIGKTALVAEIHKPITEKRGYFIAGKFDQFGRNIPYSAVVDAFAGLVRQLLTETEAQLNQWREKLLTAFGPNGQVIIDVIPEVELIVGKQLEVPELGPAESQNRFNLVFGHFIRAFCSKEHPLVIFLDDLQWADSATLKLIELMMTDNETQYLFLIGAYRDNEVNATHPLMMTLDGLRNAGATLSQIILAPLALEHMTHLICETLHSDANSVRPLAELVVEKTEGNPFFVNEFMKTLYQENLLTFNFPQSSLTKEVYRGGWQWDIAQIRTMGITDNVVELMIGKLKKLPESTQQILRLAACVGASFDLSTLSIIWEKSHLETFQDLTAALQSGLILSTSELDSQLLIQDYKFLHDRVQQAAYALIDNENKKAVHLKIGRLLLANTESEERARRIFELVDHLNAGRKLLTDEDEKIELAKLNLEAARKAKDATAYLAALKYLTVGIEGLIGDIWLTHYELVFAMHKELAEVEYLVGNFTQAEGLIYFTLERAKSVIEKADLYNLLIVQYTLTAKYKEGIEAGQKALQLLGIELPEADLEKALDIEIAEAKTNLGNKEIASLVNQPEMKIREKEVAVKLLNNMIAISYIYNQRLFYLISVKMVNLSLKYGNVPESSLGYACYGMLLGSVFGNYQSGYEFSVVALKLSEKFNSLVQKCKACEVLVGHTLHWAKHIKGSRLISNNGYQAGLDSGEFQWSGYILIYKLFALLYQGENLAVILTESQNYLVFAKKTKNHLATDSMRGLFIEISKLADLAGIKPEKFYLHNEEISEYEHLEDCKRNKNFFSICLFYIIKSQVFYLCNEFDSARRIALEAEKLLNFILGQIPVVEHNFYLALSLTALYPSTSELQQEQYWNKLETLSKQMKIWADNCPENFLHKYLLMQAEMARISGKAIEAVDLYDRAIESARENDFIQNEALANELAAKFWLSKGKQKLAKVYISEAHYGYQRWGAKRKVEDLEEKYPELLTRLTTVSCLIDSSTTTTSISSGSRSSEALDLATVMKASQAISGEIVLDKLLGSLMKILIENAGAQVGYLIWETSGQLLIEASGEVDSDNVTVLQSIPLENRLPASIINYVVRTKETLVLNNATREGNFTLDPYLKEHQTKSILCAPLINQGQLGGIVYLENNLSTGAFTPARLEVLQLLSGQAAIAIANAKLYAEVREAQNLLAQYNRTLENQVAERTQELSQALDHLKATQEELIQSEKMAALGQLIAGIAHEVNTPLGAIRSCAGTISKFLNQTLEQLPTLFQSLSPIEGQDFLALLQRSLQQELTFSTKEERQFKRALRHQLEALEIDNADTIADRLVIMGIYKEIDAFVSLLKRTDSSEILEIAYKLSEFKRGTTTINTATDRASKVVFALKTYARYDQSGEMKTANLTDGIETVLTLYQNQFKQGVEVIRNYAELPPVLCYPDELNQVWTNLIHNALQAMNYRGTLTINVTQEDQQAKISITDSGNGVPEEIQSKIFQPFFTTKPAGEGSGLGLNIVNKILKKHNGDITVESKPCRTTFNVFLPIQPIQEAQDV
jgi:predicted ATPase/signal transduction histidine kinase/tRNA A-37 threonylcarbamoyl transferase component Bud32